ncbi:hypothetical protein PPYR_06481 [Photinus pyralis]|uniref:Aminopeptidase n=1 Tax=Photinus pyralis TaxID=7054 RepID=A0A1Y1MLM2_PHOPY|nr:aminopeptidase N-like [Photinus pyralis]KAB0800742.1 hypothetical protein PPYR_06481 [Photinus pyralis]
MATLVLCLLLVLYANGALCQMDSYFLPKTIKPIRYNLTVAPDTYNTEAGLFYGNVNIDIEILENTRNVTIHVKSLTIYTALLTITDMKRRKRVGIVGTSEDTEREFYIIYLNEELEKGKRYMLTFGKYTGTLHNDMEGLFYAKYINAQNETKYMVVTEFEPSDARRTFPCFDEPALKATFILNIIRESTLMSASNEELHYTTYLGHGLYRDTYKETVPMSTYLLAFVVSEFRYYQKHPGIRMIMRPDAIAEGSMIYMLDESVKLLKVIEAYTGIPYVLKKLDMLGVPEEYFLDGAMENWGLVIYNEKYLVCTDRSHTMDIQKCATFSAHEFAHQWFGNLVSPKSWHYMWLSEGFAAYFQYFVTALAEPTWRLDEQYVVEEYQSSLRSDTAPLTEPINFVFTSPEMFPSSQIYYYKASAVIRMTEHFLTNRIFVQSLRSYLNNHKFGATVPSDLFREYQRAINRARKSHLLGGYTVNQILNSWYTNVGHPLVTVTRNYHSGTIAFTQQTFYKNGDTDGNLWYIPITYYLHKSGPRSFSDTTTDMWLVNATGTINNRFDDDWIIVNKHVIGYYRVNYDSENWRRVTNFLRTQDLKIIPPTNRAQLLDDAIYLAQCSKLDFEVALNVTTYLYRETDYIPIKSFLTNIEDLDRNLASKPEYDLFKTYIKWLLRKAYKKIGLQESPHDGHVDRLLRRLLAEWMCKFEDESCQQVGIQHVRRWRSSGVLHLSPDLQQFILCGGIQIATEDEWNFVLQRYYLTKDSNLKTQLIRGLSCIDKTSMIINFLDIIFTFKNAITPEDRSIAVGSMMQFSDNGMDTALKYFIEKRYPKSTYKANFNAVSMVIALPSRYQYQIDILKRQQGSINLPVYFYNDEALTDDELFFGIQVAHWLQIYSKDVIQSSHLH